MRILNWERGCGKTTELVRIMMQPGNEDVVYVAPTYAQADYALRVAERVFNNRREELPKEYLARFISASGLKSRMQSLLRDHKRLVIDELDGVLGALFGAEVLAVAGTCEPQKITAVAKETKN